MDVGMMNDPQRDPCDEARWAGENGFDFLDLTLEGPAAELDRIDVAALKHILDDSGMGVVGHTAWYLPFASPFRRVRQAAVDCVVETFATFAHLGARHVNVHISPVPRLYPHQQQISWNSESFCALAEQAAAYNLGIMIEHPPDGSLSVADIRAIVEAEPRLGFHLDVGHANIGGDKLEGLLKHLGNRLVHVHLSDNNGRSDQHTALGAGMIDWPRTIRMLRQSGYNDTITLEVFSRDRDYLLLSARKLRDWWAAAD